MGDRTVPIKTFLSTYPKGIFTFKWQSYLVGDPIAEN